MILRVKIGKEAVMLAVKGIGQVSSSAKVSNVQTSKGASKSSTTKAKSSSSSNKQTKSSSGKKTDSSSTKKATAKSTQTTPKEKKGSSLANDLGKAAAELAKSIVSKESKKQSDASQKGSDSNGVKKMVSSSNSSSVKMTEQSGKSGSVKPTESSSNSSSVKMTEQSGKSGSVKTTEQSGKSGSIKTTGQSSNSSNRMTNQSTKKVIAGKETTYATGAAGIYNGKGKIVSGAGIVGNPVLAPMPIVGYNSVMGAGHTPSYSFNRPEESYGTVKIKPKPGKKKETSNKKGTVKAKDGKVTISYITKPNGTEKTVVKKKPSWFEQTMKKYGEKIKYVVTDDGIQEFTSFFTGFVPYVGDGIDIIDAATGKDIITGKKLKVDERAVTTLAVVPFLTGPMAKSGLKGIKNIKGLKKVKIVTRNTDKVDEVADVGKKVVKEGREKLTKRDVKNVGDDIVKDGSHLKNGKLKPNITYKSGEFDYTYKTDSKGRISNWSTDNLQLTKRNERLKHDPKTPGKTQGDHAGHLAGDRFGGSPEIDNLVSQASSVNLSEYKKIENQWAKAIREGKKVTTDVTILYEGDSLRPKGFEVEYTINQEMFYRKITN